MLSGYFTKEVIHFKARRSSENQLEAWKCQGQREGQAPRLTAWPAGSEGSISTGTFTATHLSHLRVTRGSTTRTGALTGRVRTRLTYWLRESGLRPLSFPGGRQVLPSTQATQYREKAFSSKEMGTRVERLDADQKAAITDSLHLR